MKGETSNVTFQSSTSHVSRLTSHVRYPALDALLLVLLLNLALQPLVEPDFGWHIRTGLDLLKNGWRMPALDPYSHTMPDWAWVEHAWLTDGLLGWLYQGLGSAGPLAVILFFAAMTLTAFLGMAGVSQANRTYRFVAVAVALWIALPFLGARTQLVTLLGLTVLIGLFHRYLVGRPAHLWMVPPLFLLWANLHGGFTAGLFLLLIWLLVSTGLRLVVDRRPGLAGRFDEPVLSWPHIRHLALIILLSALVTLLNPYGWRLHAEIFSSLNDTFMLRTLDEWQPVSWERRAGMVYLVYLGVLGLAVSGLYRRVQPMRWVVLAVFLVLSLKHWRNVLFFLLFSVPLLADLLAEATRRVSALLRLDRVGAKRRLLAATVALALGIVSLGSDHLEHVVQSGLAPRDYFRQTEYPIEAVQWIGEHRGQLGQKLYNDYGMGGFLLWWLPGEKIFIDGRMPAFRIGDRWIFKDYLALVNGSPPDLDVLKKYGVDWAIVAKDTPLERALAAQAGWRDVYHDLKVTIYVRQE